jgi:hypothetical protein
LAKKRKQKTEKKVEYDFKVPEFDEHEYISLELRKSKMSFLAFLYALLIVVVTYFIYTLTHPDWRFPVVIGLFSVAALPLIVNAIKLDTTGFDWKNWVGSGAVYILSWLAIFIIVVNPPFSDFSGPDINEDNFSIEYKRINENSGDWRPWNKSMDPPSLGSPQIIKFRAKVTDNVEVDEDSVRLILDRSILPNSNESIFEMRAVGDNHYERTLEISNTTTGFKRGIFKFTIEASDMNGHKDSTSRRFQIFQIGG